MSNPIPLAAPDGTVKPEPHTDDDDGEDDR